MTTKNTTHTEQTKKNIKKEAVKSEAITAVKEIIELQIDETMNKVLADPTNTRTLVYPPSHFQTVYDCLQSWFKARTLEFADLCHKTIKINFDNSLPTRSYVIFMKR